jgi:hypothetical protein
MTTHYDDRPLYYDDTYRGARYTYGLAYRHGTVQYARRLTSGEIAAFQLTPLVQDEAAPKGA